MDLLIVATAQYLPALVVVAAVGIWLTLPRGEKVGLAVQALLSLALVAVLIHVAAGIHTDPRPFVVDRSLTPLFAHSADNGFPSDHTALAATVALLVMRYRRGLGAVLLAASVGVGVARVAAHVHHVQDIVGGLLVAVVTVAIVAAVWRWARLARGHTALAGRDYRQSDASETVSAPTRWGQRIRRRRRCCRRSGRSSC
jgi:membrane-associated phospholipid phosphatase